MKLKALLVALFAVVAIAPAVPADAGNKLTINPQTCPATASYEARVCIDISSKLVFIYTTPGTYGWSVPTYQGSVQGTLDGSQPIPLNNLPWRADDYECNTVPDSVNTFFNIGPVGAQQGVLLFTPPTPATSHYWYLNPVSSTIRDIVAWVINLNGSNGSPPYECIVVY